jgi:formylglycine-generating enzyme required for sulfatase activity
MIAMVALVGCGKKKHELSTEKVITPNEVANKLFVEAVELVEDAQSKEAHDVKGAIAGYERALAKVREITREYKESDIAVKLVSGETLFTGKTMAQIKERIGELQLRPKTFTNTLGMKFVTVPGTEVSFCIWETRVKDYAAYAAANAGVDASWKKPSFAGTSFTQEDTHPVVNVSWNEAQAFCEWLTKKELAEGKIKVGQKYRLPTDA